MTRYKTIRVMRHGFFGYKALLVWTTGMWWWKRTHERAAITIGGIVWEWEDGVPGFVDPRTCTPALDAVVRRLELTSTPKWEAEDDAFE